MSDNIYLTDQIYTENIYINPNELNNNIDKLILKKLKNNIEGKCNNYGYIIKNSISLISKSLGTFTDNCIKYTVKYKTSILSPSNDNIIECYIDSINKMGILAYIKLNDIIKDKNSENLLDSPFIIIIPENRIDDINNYNIKQKIKIKVIASRTKYKSDKIQIIGTIVV